MYGGLFGDLPAAKNSAKNEPKKKGNEETSRATVKQEPAPSAPLLGSLLAPTPPKENSIEKDGDDQNSKKQRVEGGTDQGKGSSVVQKVGIAGTSMAFVPTHLKRKRNLAKKSQSKPTSTGNKTSTTSTTTTAKLASSQPQPTSTKFATLGHVTEEIKVQKDDAAPEVISLHPVSSNLPQTEARESEELQKLHDDVTDPYDPMVPNDLLQYWERQAAILERQEMEREARETLEQQNRVREQMERERMELLKSGDINALAARGRGRGISNVPAWLVEKQKKEAQLGKQSESS